MVNYDPSVTDALRWNRPRVATVGTAAELLSFVHYLFRQYQEGMEDRSIILTITFKAALLERWQHLELSCEACGVSIYFDLQRLRDRTNHRVISEFVSRAHCRICGSPPTAAYLIKTFAENDPLRQMSFHVEEWTDDGMRRQALLSACHSAGAGRGAFELTTKERPKQFLTLRKGTWLLATTRPDPPPDNVMPIGARSPLEEAGADGGQMTIARRRRRR